MKMKLAQRLVIGYYKAQLRTIAMVSSRKAAEKAFDIFCTPYSKGVKQKEPPIFHKATKKQLVFDGLKISGFQWNPEQGHGKKILIVHGFSSYSYKFEKYIQPLLKEGFEVLAFDAPGHGLSEGNRINALIYQRFLLTIEEQLGSLYGFIAHSLGGLASTLAIEQLAGERKLVLIAPATETRSATAGFYNMFRIDASVQAEFEQLIFRMTGLSLEHFSVSRAIRVIRSPVLWIHDKKDTICPYADTLPVQSQNLSHVQFHITNGLGHNKIYRDKEVIQTVIHFLTKDSV